MKSIREFIYLSQKAGILNAIYYIIYKVDLKFKNIFFNKKYIERKRKKIENIYGHLSVYNNKTDIINLKKLIVISDKGNYNKIYLRPFSSDTNVYSQVIIQKSYQPVIEIYDQVFKSAPINFLDLGANIGLTCLFFASRYKGLKIVAFEPFPQNAEMAILNMTTNNLENFKLIEGGVWNKNTQLSLKRDFRDGAEWGVSLIESSNGTITGYDLKEFIDNYTELIDFLKIDIEGAESILFNDPYYASGFLTKVKCVAIEIHDEFECRNTIYQVFSKNKFIYYNTDDMTIALNTNYF